MNKEKRLIPILWTGGWDSTYRVVELSRQDVEVQPVYIFDKNRKSNQKEIEAIRTITNLLRERKETLATINDLKIIKVADIPKDEAITAAWKVLAKETGFGEQHEWTARVAKDFPMIEMCIEKVLVGYMPTRISIKNHGAITQSETGEYIIDREKSDDILNLVLGNISLPIFETTEVQMRENIEAWGYEDVMQHIWFCHTPIDGKPCGVCSPCHTKYDSDMLFLLPESAQKRCAKKEEITKKYGVLAGKVYKHIAQLFKVI